jgi:N-acetylmuramoyl-L-alanine amidase
MSCGPQPVRAGTGRLGTDNDMWKAVSLGLMLAGLLGHATAMAGAATEPVALSAQLTGDASRTILSLDVNHPFAYKVFALDNPYRVVIEMPAVEFRLPRSAAIQGLGLVSDYRYGMVGPGHSRLVINTTGPVLVESAGILSKDGVGPSTFKIVLAGTDAKTFLSRLPRRAVKVAKAAPVQAAASAIPRPLAPSAKRDLPLVVLDPGHGGPDSGAVGPDGGEEKDAVLAIGLKVRELLLATGRYKVSMTRDTDVFIPLSGRVDHAEKRRADLMVSIHADSTASGRRWQPVSGATIYTRSETASDEASRLLAMKENMADQLAGEALPSDEGNTVSNIGMDVARMETKALEQILAEEAVNELKKATPMTQEPRRSARFYVLKSPEVPAMLVETGYMNNKRDSPRLQSSAGQQKIAAGITAAIEAYFGKRGEGIATVLGLSLPVPLQ